MPPAQRPFDGAVGFAIRSSRAEDDVLVCCLEQVCGDAAAFA
jgi:hypothetical protein